ncbi:NAD(P)-dependent oxidoreductase [Tissierella creatinini]|nr:NAD(P)-dependent oxidoreductase [Tissierella creatinini]TJX61551.1 NAD(P)-dependent oxidoreductase [Soehngenia saccharolytica]
MKKVIVTGVSGFVGKSFTKRLLEEGITVYAVVRNGDKISDLKQYNNLIPVIANMEEYKDLHKRISRKDIDVFYHFAWGGVYDEAKKDYNLQLDNVRYSCDALKSAIEINCKKFVFAGSVNEYETKANMDKVGLKQRYTNIYGGSKLLAEIICKTIANNEGIEYSAGLSTLAYGEGNKSKMLLNIIIKKLLNNESPSLISGENKYDVIYIDDLVNAFIAIGEKGLNQKSYYVGHRKLKTFKEIMTNIRDIINPNIDLKFGERNDSIDFDYSTIDLDALYLNTGFECKTDFEESIQATADWIRTININIQSEEV